MTNTRRRPTALRRLLDALLGSLDRRGSGARSGSGSAAARRPDARSAGAGEREQDARPAPAGRSGGARTGLAEADSPGRSGPDATVEIDPAGIRGVRVAYAPDDDDAPDPGEVVWTWVPFEERDGRGKDRPVVIVAADGRGGFLGLQLTSKAHDDRRDYLELGSGAWDAEGRGSWADLSRVFLVRTGGMRREAAVLDRARYDRLADAVRARYGWR